jgi:dihydroorotase
VSEPALDDALRPHPGGGTLLVRGARSYPPGKAAEPLDVRVVDGRIAEIGRALAPHGASVLDARGLTLVPGLVDVHVHFRDPGLAHKEGWETGSAGALHGGVTTVVEVQNNPPLSTSLALLRARLEHVRARSRVDFGCLANLLSESLPELAAMAHWTPAFKCFLGGSTGVSGQADPGALRALFAAAARAGRMIVGHCEDETLLQEGRRSHPDASAREHHLVRSHAAEVQSIRAAIALAEESGAELHVFHVSTGQGVDLVRAARRAGQAVGASTAPHYVLFSCEDAVPLGNRLKVNPSIKSQADGQAILRGLADGTLEAIGTDHAPHPPEEKQRPYRHAPSGMPSVDLLWPLTWELVRRGWLAPDVALCAVTEGAARALHLPNKGRLEPGCDGDFVLFDPARERSVVGAELPSRSKWSAYEGWRLAGFPELVVRRGVLAWRAGRPVDEAGHGAGGRAGGEPLALAPTRRFAPRA